MSHVNCFVIFLIFLGGCRPDTIPCKDVTYSFAATATFIDGRELYHIGDTLKIRSELPTSLTDLSNGQVINYTNSTGFFTNIGCILLDSVNKRFIGAIDSIQLGAEVGVIQPPPGGADRLKTIKFLEEPNKYSFLINLIFLKKGRYQFVIQDGGSKGIIGKNCTNSSLVFKINNIEKNLQILQNTQVANFIIDQYISDRSYCVRVE